MRPFASSTAFRSKWGGFRVTYYDADRNPIVSLWGEYPVALNRKAMHLLEAQPGPVDSVLQSALWRGKKAKA